ncbi:hypothetical protein [Gottfriedia luciferensis]|uniref:hypothetical protein n=1 Tax=Gottfriedia luciferensis TaxID=178774 RepID=UPI000B42ECB5|nr:hypothetical protein [Gottfriedia luciferensis]
MFNWISYEDGGGVEMALQKIKVTYKGKETNGDPWSDKREVYRIAPHIILDVYDGNSDEFVFRILDEELYRNKDEIVIDDENYNQYIKTVGGYIDGWDIDFIEQHQELIVSDPFIKAIEYLGGIQK